MNLGQKIKVLRDARGLTLQQIADLWEISRSSVSGWESNASRPDVDKLPGLARILGVTVDELLSERPIFSFGQDRVDYNVKPLDTTGRLPRISWVQAGDWGDIVDNFQPGDAEDWILCPFDHGPHAFILQVSGHSMYNPGGEKSYSPGEFIAVDPSREARNKSMVIARIDGEQRATFKQLITDPEGTMMLQALNPSHVPRIMTLPADSSIVGVVIGKWVPE